MPSAEKRQKPRGFKQSRNGLREAILGLLAIRPMTGYDLSRSYRRALQQIWYAPLGQVYPMLRKIRRDGLLRVSVKVQRHRPNRKIYSLTAEGRKLLVLWLSQPAALPRMHHEFCFNSATSKQPTAANWSRPISSAAGNGPWTCAALRRCWSPR